MFRRHTQRLRLILVMMGMAGFVFGSGSLVNGASWTPAAADEVEILIADDAPSEGRGRNLAFRSAKRPIVVPISFGIVDGKPRIQKDASEVVLEQLREHSSRLITIEIEGLPISFKSLPRSTRGKLLERGGSDFPARYDRFVARELVSLLDSVRASRPRSPLSIKGLPFEDGGGNDSLSNARFAAVIERLSAFVLDRGVVVSSRSDEQTVFYRSFPNAVRLAGGRAVIYPLNLGWRLAIEGESLVLNGTGNTSGRERPGERLENGQTATAGGRTTPMMSDLDELGVAGRASERSMVGVDSGSGRAQGPPQNSSTGSGGNGAASTSGGGGAVGAGGGGGGSGGSADGRSALPFGRNQQQATVDEEVFADDVAGEEPPADDEAGEEPPADDDAGEEPPADDDAGEEPPADDDAGEEPPADDDAGEDNDSEWDPEDEVDDDEPPTDDGAEGDPGEDPPADDDTDGDAGEDPPADDPPADESEEWVPIEWESLGDLQLLVNATASGGTIDLEGRFFGAGALDSAGLTQFVRDHGKDLVIKNGLISGTRLVQWTRDPEQPQLLLGTLPSESEFSMLTGLSGASEASPGDAISPLLDFKRQDQPRLAVWPSPPEERLDFPASYNPNWIILRHETTGENNGIIETVDGNDVVGSRVTGFQITNPVQRSRVAEALEGVDPSFLILIYRTGANIVKETRVSSWDPNSGKVEFAGEGLRLSAFFQFAFTGSKKFITEDGQYALDLKRKQIAYQSTGDGTDVRIAALANLWLTPQVGGVEFQGVTFVGTNANGSAPSMVTKYHSGSIEHRSVLRDCTMMIGAHAVRGDYDIFGTKVGPFRTYGVTVTDGTTVEKCFFYPVEKFECLTVMCDLANGVDVPVRPSVIRDCFFTNPITNHGQGLSLYNHSWQNATVEHNLFLDCERAFSFQSRSPMRITPGVFRFANNLLIFDDPLEQLPNGQPTISFNGSLGDVHLDERQVVEVLSNTVVYNRDSVDPAAWYAPMNIDLQRMTKSTAVVANNIAASINACAQADDSKAHLRSNNLLYRPGWDAGWGQTDLQTPASFEAIFDFEYLAPQGYARFSASDGGQVGFRWGGSPTMSEVRSLPDDWYEVWPALEIPVGIGTSFTWRHEDYR